MSKISDVAGTDEDIPKGESAEGNSIPVMVFPGHSVKNAMTVITRWSAIDFDFVSTFKGAMRRHCSFFYRIGNSSYSIKTLRGALNIQWMFV